MNRTKKLSASIILIAALLVTTVSAVTMWTSNPITKTINLEGLDGAIISVSAFGNYAAKTEPTDFNTEYTDIRQDSFIVAVQDMNIDGDLTLAIQVAGVPEGVTVSAKMAFLCLYNYDGSASQVIKVFNPSGGAGVTAYEKVSDTETWSVVDFSGMSNVPVNSGVATITNGDIAKTMYQTQSFTTTSPPTVDDCNGVWIQLSFDTSGATVYGSFETITTVTLGEV